LYFIVVNALVTKTGGFIDDNGINITGNEGLHSKAKLIKGADAVSANPGFSGVVVGGAKLGANQQVFISGKFIGGFKAVFINTNQQTLINGDVAI